MEETSGRKKKRRRGGREGPTTSGARGARGEGMNEGTDGRTGEGPIELYGRRRKAPLPGYRSCNLRQPGVRSFFVALAWRHSAVHTLRSKQDGRACP